MNKPLLFFNGTDVMLIPEQYVPTKPDLLKRMHEWQQDYLSGALIRNGVQWSPSELNDDQQKKIAVYQEALEAAKSKAIRVENYSCRNQTGGTGKSSDAILCIAENGRDVPIIDVVEVGQIYPLHEGYKYERQCDCGSESCVGANTCVISPVQPEQSEDELWSDVHRIIDSYEGRHSSGTIVAYLKSKYHITKRTP